MRDTPSRNTTADVWLTFFDTRAVGLVVLAIAVFSPVVPVDDSVGVFALTVGVPLTITYRFALDFVMQRSWIVLVLDAVVICTAISLDPVIAPAGGVLLIASSSLTAATGWRPTVAANLVTAPLVVFVLDRYAPDTTLPIALSHLVCSVGVAIFVAQIARAELDQRLDRERLLDGLDAVVWEAHPYPFVEARLSGRTTELLGVDPSALSGPGGWLARVPASDRARVAAQSQQLIAEGRDHELTYRVLTEDGDLRHVRDRVRVQLDAEGRPATTRGIVVDVTEEVRVREINRNLAELVERVEVGLLVIRWHDVMGERSFTTLSVNPAYEALTGHPATALVNADAFDTIEGPGRATLEHVVRRTAETGRPQKVDEADDLRTDGRAVVSLETFPISDRLIGVTVSDVTERVTTADTLRHQALHDALTGLPNRALLEDRLRHSISVAERDGNSVGLMLLDLNQFKDVNDTLGHDQGDRLLQHIAHRLRDVVRGGDTVARLGGDEFAFLLADDVSPRRILSAAERVLQCFDDPIDVDGISLQCGGSLGVAIFPEHGTSADELRQHADIAMYVAKRRGGGVEVYDPVRDQPDKHRLTLVSQLRAAIDEDTLDLHYQPMIELATGRVHGVEALVRWTHEERGPIPPIDFIDLAEVSGLIRPLTGWVLDRALEDIGDFHARGMDLGISINVSVRNLYEPHFVESVAARLAQHGVDGRHITMELTETQVMDDPILAHNVLGRLRELGIRSSVDDFGTGHSSLSNLQSLPVSEVKIDKSFVQAMADKDEAATAIVKSIVSLGHNLGMTVVAEGVETNEAMTSLSLLGCDRVQGYLFGRPMPVNELHDFVLGARHGTGS